MASNNNSERDSSKKLPTIVWLLSWVSFFADISSEMVYPLLPFFMISVIGASKTKLGIMEGSAVLIVALMSAYAGIQSDRATSSGGRTRWLRIGYFLPVVGKLLIAFATAWPVVIGGRLLDRFGKGLRGAPRDALISDAVSADLRGRAFGLHRTFDTSGALIGVLLSALLLWWLTGTSRPDSSMIESNSLLQTPAWVYRVILGVGAGLGLAAWLLTFLVRERDPILSESNSIASEKNIVENEPTPKFDVDSTNSTSGYNFFGLPKAYWSVILVLLLFSLANSSDTFLLLRVQDLGFSPVVVVLVYALYNVTYAGFSYPIGALSDRIGRWRIIAAGWFIYAGVYLGMGLLPNRYAWGVWPIMAVYGLYMALTDGVGKALIADHAPAHRRGAAMGIYHALTGLTTLIASLIAGYAWDRAGPSIALLIGAGFALSALAGVWLCQKQLVGNRASFPV